MKKAALFLLMVLGLLACNQEDEKESEVRDALLGHWVYSSMEVNGSDILSNMDYQIEMELKADSTFQREIGEVIETGTWMLINDTTIYIEPDFSELGGQELHLVKLTDEEVRYIIRSEGDEAEVTVTLSRVEKDSEE